jgi:hypothetical protein
MQIGMPMAMDHIAYVLDIEDAFAIRIADEDAANMNKIGDMHDYLVRRLPAIDPNAIWERQLDVLAKLKKLGAVQRKSIRPEDHFVRDLGFN